MTAGITAGMKTSYRAWVEGGARGFFLTPSVAVNAVRLINPLDRRGGYFVRRDTSYPAQAERRALLALRDQEDGEREDVYARDRLARSPHRHVLACDSEPTPAPANSRANSLANDDSECAGWIVTARVERPAEVVRRGWLAWESVGEVVEQRPQRPERGA